MDRPQLGGPPQRLLFPVLGTPKKRPLPQKPSFQKGKAAKKPPERRGRPQGGGGRDDREPKGGKGGLKRRKKLELSGGKRDNGEGKQLFSMFFPFCWPPPRGPYPPPQIRHSPFLSPTPNPPLRPIRGEVDILAILNRSPPKRPNRGTGLPIFPGGGQTPFSQNCRPWGGAWKKTPLLQPKLSIPSMNRDRGFLAPKRRASQFVTKFGGAKTPTPPGREIPHNAGGLGPGRGPGGDDQRFLGAP